MRKQPIPCLTVAVLLGLILACAPGADESGPGGAVQRLYRHLNDGDYAAAKGLYNSEARALLDDPDFSSEEGFRTWARQHTREGTVSNVDILSVDTVGEEARVEFRIVFEDGSSESGQVTATLEDGEWKLGLLG